MKKIQRDYTIGPKLNNKGNDTRLELEYAKNKGKTIQYLEGFGEK